MTTPHGISPRVVVVVPARGGSKGVPLKNLERVAGRSLVARAVDAALAASTVDLVVVSTDHPAIATEALAAGARVVNRPVDLADDRASSESALLHALDVLAAEGIDPKVTVLVQATSPFIDPATLDRAVRRVLDEENDCVLAAATTHAFVWRVVDGQAEAVDHDAGERVRRQDREARFRETGAFYAMRTTGLRAAGHRFFGRIGVELVDEHDSLEIDTKEDLQLARALATVSRAQTIDVDAVVTDFDGVHTDDRAWVDRDGREFVAVSRSDGWGVAALRDAGLAVLVLSTETDGVVSARAEKLRIECRQAVGDKAEVLRQWMGGRGLDPSRVAFIGNDVNDLPALAVVGWPVAVADAHPRVVEAARCILSRRGGNGAVREFADIVLTSRSSARDQPHALAERSS